MGRWRKRGEERKPGPRHRTAACQGGRSKGCRDRRPGRWLHGSSGRCVCDRADGESGERHSAHRGLPGGHLASSGVASGAQAFPDEMGIDALTGPGRRAVFLDRDGVINRAVVRGGKPYPPSNVDELVILDGVAEALCELHDAGYLLIVVTNQPDVARGTQSVATVEAMHQFLRERLILDEIVACYHDGETCSCRKPRPGALFDA